jgi:hypothetical protein
VIRDEPPFLILLVSISDADHAGEGPLALFQAEQDKEILLLFFEGSALEARTPIAKAAGNCRPLESERLSFRSGPVIWPLSG